MKARRLVYFITLLALFTLIGSPSFAENGQYNDTGNHWAAESIAQCEIYQLMSGYPGNLFRPDQSLSKAEALTVIARAKGWAGDANTQSLAGIKFPPDLWSGFKGYIAQAVNNQIINKETVPSMKFNEPATRIEMARWLAKAMNLTGNAAELSFYDVASVPVEDRNLLVGVVKAGILKGMPGNLFAPSKPLTRAEASTILTRMIDNGKITPSAGRQVTGKLKNVDWVQQKITVEQSSGSNSYDLDSSYRVYRLGRKTNPTDLSVDENVKLSLNSSGKCVLISYTNDSLTGETRVYSGTVSSLNSDILAFQPNSGSPLFLSVSPQAVVTVSGSPAALASVRAGAKGSITVNRGLVTRIDLSSSLLPVSDGLKGYVVNKYWDHCTVRLTGGKVEEVPSTGVLFVLNGIPSSYSAIQRGSPVQLVKSGSLVTAVYVLDGPRKVFGETQDVGTSSITIDDADDKTTDFRLARNVRVMDRDGDRADLEDIEEGDDVELTLDTSEQVTEIRMGIDSGNDLWGRVEDIRTSGARRITIEDEDGETHTYALADDVTVQQDGSSRSLSSVKVDMWVELSLDRDDEADFIEIIGSEVVEGEVTDIRTSGSKRIDIEESNGDEETYYLEEDVVIREDGSARDLDDIEEGMNVRLTLNEDDRVSWIEIIDESTVEGQVDFLSTTGSDRIRIERSNGDLETYYLDDDVTVKENGSSRDLDDIEDGMEVRLSLNSSRDVTRIDILDQADNNSNVEGEVTHIQPVGNNRFIEIEENNGEQNTYDLANSVTVREGSEIRGLNYVLTGMKVQLNLNSNNEVTRIDIDGLSESSTVDGEVTYIKRTGDRRIEIQDSDGDTQTYYMYSDVTVRENGSRRDLDDVDVGLFVKLTLDNEEVTRIDIYGSSTVSGVVTYIRITGSERIEIEDEDGNRETYYLDENVYVRENGNNRDLDDIGEGMRVELTLDDDDTVTRIEITGVSYVTGEIIYIRTTGTLRIEIDKNHGGEEDYYLNNDVTVLEDGVVRGLNDVEKDMDVRLFLDNDERVSRIEIL